VVQSLRACAVHKLATILIFEEAARSLMRRVALACLSNFYYVSSNKGYRFRLKVIGWREILVERCAFATAIGRNLMEPGYCISTSEREHEHEHEHYRAVIVAKVIDAAFAMLRLTITDIDQ
jgi:hypothetical protein